MRIASHISFFLIVCLSAAINAATNVKEAKKNNIVIQETQLLMKEVDTIITNAKKEDIKKADFWRNAYTSLDTALEKYKKADSEAITGVNETRSLFESIYDFRKDNELTTENTIKFFAYVINTIHAKGTTVPDAINQNNFEQKKLFEKIVKCDFHMKQLEINLCKKYQIRCTQ